MRCLIVSADDFGLTRSINEGIFKAQREGIVTFINVLANGEALEDAAGLIKKYGIEEIGAHLSLTEIRPITEKSRIQSLVTKKGEFPRSHTAFAVRFGMGKANLGHLNIELEAQLARIESLGAKITSISSHGHIHMIPAIMEIFVRLAKKHGIPAIRYPRQERPSRGLCAANIKKRLILGYFEKGMEKAVRAEGLSYTDHFAGFLSSGRITEHTLIDILKNLEDGTTELVCHPGFIGPEILNQYQWHKGCEEELYALTSPKVKKLIKDQDIRLVTYSQFISSRPK